jgi:hypothetical protein
MNIICFRRQIPPNKISNFRAIIQVFLFFKLFYNLPDILNILTV